MEEFEVNKKAVRIHHRERLKEKRKKYWMNWSYTNSKYREDPKAIGKLLSTPKMCSCWMCANARKHHGPTIKEVRDYQPKLQDLEINDDWLRKDSEEDGTHD